jgi:hypothetical protein
MTLSSYSYEDRRKLRRAFVSGGPLICPACGVDLDRRPVRPRTDVSYVRERLWVSCPRCHASAVLDRRESA